MTRCLITDERLAREKLTAGRRFLNDSRLTGFTVVISARSRTFVVRTQLRSLGSFDTLVAAVLLIALSEEIASPELRERVLSLYVGLHAGLRTLPETAPFFPDLFSCIDRTCEHWVYLSPNQRMDVVIFWQGVQIEAERRAGDRPTDD